ncbi:hypothetical protein ACFT38_28425 [Streptomyces sp. NPDC056975]|uniref:hypothetical protein n=1 Tax=Streptomyces sp. NPDC056975 TaxID=3345985 RepID=UPI0036303B2C
MSGKHVIPASTPVTGFVELGDEHDPIVHVPDPYNPNRSVAVRRSSLAPTLPSEARDLTPQPLLDPKAQRYIGAGVGAGVAAWGGGHLLAGASALMSAATGFGVTIASIIFMMTVARVAVALRRPRTVNVKNVNVLGGRSKTST